MYKWITLLYTWNIENQLYFNLKIINKERKKERKKTTPPRPLDSAWFLTVEHSQDWRRQGYIYGQQGKLLLYHTVW